MNTNPHCPCPKPTCGNHGKCVSCVIKHKKTDSLPFCLFPNNGGDKSVQHYYEVLKERFEGTTEIDKASSLAYDTHRE